MPIFWVAAGALPKASAHAVRLCGALLVSFGSTTAKRAGRRSGAAVKSKGILKISKNLRPVTEGTIFCTTKPPTACPAYPGGQVVSVQVAIFDGQTALPLPHSTKLTARDVSYSFRYSPTPLACLNRARDLLDCSSFSRPRLARKYSIADRIKSCVTCLEGASRSDVGCTNFSFALNTLSCRIVCRGVTPRPLRCVLRPHAPAAHLSSVELPHLINPIQHLCEFRLRLRQMLAQSK